MTQLDWVLLGVIGLLTGVIVVLIRELGVTRMHRNVLMANVRNACVTAKAFWVHDHQAYVIMRCTDGKYLRSLTHVPYYTNDITMISPDCMFSGWEVNGKLRKMVARLGYIYDGHVG